MKRVIIPLIVLLSGCSGEAPRVERVIRKDLTGMTVTEVKHTETTSTISWSVPASYESIMMSARAGNGSEVKLPALPKKIFATVSFYTKEGGQLLFSDKSESVILSPGQSNVFTKEIDVLRDTAAKIGYWEATVGPAK
jgi:hypothetical protein